VNSHQSAGSAALAARKWDEANQHFNRVLELSPNDAKATAGLNDTARLRNAYGTEREAIAALEAKNYRSSLTLFDQAIAAAPEVGEFKQKKQQAVESWTAALTDGLENLMSDQTSREKTRDAYVRIEDLRSLNGSHQSVKDLGEQIRQNFGGTLLDRSTELAGLQDFSRTGTAAISKARASELLPAGTIKIEDLKDVFENFNKRRATQLLIASTDLSGADPVFIQTATLRAKSAAENASLPDVRVRNLADYEKQPEEDSILRGVLVDGKSSTVLLTVSVTKYSNFKKQGDTKRVKSQFNGPLENVPNPRYKELQAEIASINRDLADEKKKKDWERLKVELGVKTGQITNGTVKEYNSETKKVDYDYLEVSWAQDISIEVSLTLKDYFTQTTISAPAPIVVTRHIPDVEISGVHKDDSQGLQDRKPTRISDDALTEARNQVLERITSLTAETLPHYTRRFFVDGDAAKTVEPERAVEDFISHWAFFRGKLEKKELDSISDFVRQHTGYSLVADGPRLLQRSLVTTATVDRR
jgi:tetratricopeptide (TPR) repeat protein